MQDEEKYKALLDSDSSEDHLLAIELMQSQLNWPKEKAIGVSIIQYIRQFKRVEDKNHLHFGTISVILKICYYLDNKQADTWDVYHLYSIQKEGKEIAAHKGAVYKTIQQHSLIDLKSMQSAYLREFKLLLADLVRLL